MKPSDMAALIEENFRIQRHPLFFQGSPGIGKTAVVDQVADKLRTEFRNFHLRTIILSQFESVDLRGVPSVNHKEQTTVWNPPQDLTFPKDAHGIIFMDELPNAAPDVQKASQQLIHSRQLGDLMIPAGITFVAAGNRVTDRAGANRMLTALANRFEWHDVDADMEDWSKWAIKAGVDHVVIAFLNHFPQRFNEFSPENSINNTPRTWHKVSQVLGSAFETSRVFGLVGKGPGAEFMAFCGMWRELPDRREIYKNPQKVPVPTKNDVKYAISMALALSADKNNYKPSIEYIERMSREWQTQFVKAACMANPEMNTMPEFAAWIRKNKDLLQVS